MKYDFDYVIDRRSSNSVKWNWFAADVLPMWVADMDFVVAEPVIRTLRAKVDHGIFGYEMPPAALVEAVCARMDRLYHWVIAPETVVVVPGVVSGANVAARAICAPGDGVLIQPPVYPPFLEASKHNALTQQMAELSLVRRGTRLHYEIDFDRFEAAITERTRLFILCQPHNPTGQIYTRDDLTRIAEICQRHNLVICSDEIHSELLLGGAQHVATATLSPEIADRTITLISASKTFNMPGLSCSFAIIPNADLRQKFKAAGEGLVPWPNGMGLAAALAAFTEGDEWLAQVRAYLTANRDTLVSYLAEHLPDLPVTVPDATYLAWLDCRDLIARGVMTSPPEKFFVERARVGLNDGAPFGPGGEGFVRLNFGCPRSTLLEGLRRITDAVKGVPAH